MPRPSLDQICIGLLAAGAISFAFGFLSILILPYESGLVPSILVSGGAGLVIIGAVGFLALRTRPLAIQWRTTGWRGLARERKAGLVVLGLGILGAAVMTFALPPLQEFGACHDTETFGPYPDGVWLAVRDPQLESAQPAYYAESDVTYVLAGCGHGASEFALRIRGNHSDLTEFRFLLAADGPVSTRFQEVNASLGLSVDRATEEVFERRTAALHSSVIIGVLVLLSAGLSLVTLPARLGAAPVAGSAAGAWIAWSQLDAGYHFGTFLVGIPFLFLVFSTGAIMLSTVKRPAARAVALAFLLLALTAFFTVVFLIAAYPTDPEA